MLAHRDRLRGAALARTEASVALRTTSGCTHGGVSLHYNRLTTSITGRRKTVKSRFASHW
jgi:hypothetical protein